MTSRRHQNTKAGKAYGALKRTVSAVRFKRPALASLHPNSRLGNGMVRLTRSTSDAALEVPDTGSKRKRTVSTNRTSLKRRKNEIPPLLSETEDEQEGAEESVAEESHSGGEVESDDDDSDEYLMNHAPKWRLMHVRKEELARLHDLAELDGNALTLNKAELVRLLMSTRSIRSTRYQNSQPSSQGDVTEEEEDDDAGSSSQAGPSKKQPGKISRRQTENFPSTRPRGIPTTRSVSLGNLADQLPLKALPARARRTSAQSNLAGLPQHLAPPISICPSPRKTRSKARLQEASNLQVNHTKRWPSTPVSSQPSETENNEVDAPPQPSPRRLRKRTSAGADAGSHGHHREKPAFARPKRKARFEGSFREDSDAEVDELEDDEDPAEAQVGDSADEVDELASDVEDDVQRSQNSRGITRRTRPPAAGKRSRRTHPSQMHTPPSDDEDEDVLEEEEEDADGDTDENVSREAEDAEVDEEQEEADEDGVRVLRNGKVLGEVPEADEELETGSSMEVDENEEVDELEDEEVEVEDEDSGEVEEQDSGEIEEDDVEYEAPADEDEVDIESANMKSLLRHRRDLLVRLCEANDIEAEGTETKNQLARALLQWRDSNANAPASPTEPSSSGSVSSVGTQRPPSTRKPARRGTGSMRPPPVPLLFRNHIHISPVPATPPISAKAYEKEDDIELDLESLGLHDREIPPGKIIKQEKIGSGGFKDVFIGKYGTRKVAISEFRGQLSAMDIKELKLLREFNHPNVVKFFGVSIPADTRMTPVMIISELCPNGDLFDFIRNTPALGLHAVLGLMRDMAAGVEYLHLRTPSIIHRDCKSSNILITAKRTAKITDFGLAKVKQSTQSMVRSLVGTVNWQAPELWHPQPKYDHKVDVFSCAMVNWEMLQWHQPKKMYPWEGMNEHAIYDLVGKKEQRPSIHGMRKLWCPEVVDLIERMWAQDPRHRPTISQVFRDLEALLAKY